jgi:GNAT superfamily N-acetyltransferase
MTPTLTITPVTAKREVWALFAPHHYMSADLNAAAACWLVEWDRTPVAFTSAITMPSGTLQNAWREHRTVVLPDYQGLGIGAVLGDWLGQYHVDAGRRFYSRTTHPRLAAYRRQSPLWRETKKSGKQRQGHWSSAGAGDGVKKPGRWAADTVRVASSFEYVG